MVVAAFVVVVMVVVVVVVVVIVVVEVIGFVVVVLGGLEGNNVSGLVSTPMVVDGLLVAKHCCRTSLWNRLMTMY